MEPEQSRPAARFGNRIGATSVRRIVAILFVLAIGAAAYFFFFQNPPLVKVASAILAPVSEIIYATGIVEPVQWAKVVPLQRRRVVDLCRCEGQTVTKGQILGRQDDAEERAVLKEMEIRHEQLVRDRDRAERDRERGNISKAEFEQRETAVKESSTRINAQVNRLETLVFRAPMDGMVLRRDGEVGEIAGPTDVLFWVGKPSPLQVVAEINEEEITKIAVGQTAFLSNEAFATQPLRASVSQVTPKGDPAKKTFRIYLLLPPDTPLRIGMTAEANIVFREKASAVVVPLDAVLNGAVQVVSDDRVRRVPVSAGVRGTQFVEIMGDVSAGALVLSPARIDLADGARVQTDGSTREAWIDPSKTGRNPPDAPSYGKESGSDASVDLAISAALSAHIQSIVNDARRNASNSPEGRRSNPSTR